ncbi:hypothetical protein KY360_00525 [Candidatus Woesearchaeota archaeon]|nr:hypothetical protein [Candidatus Woesearchaeota archaeon]
MNKKILLVISAIIVLTGLAIITITTITSRPKVLPYSDDPKTWVSKEKEAMVISVDDVTKGQGFDAGDDFYLDIDGTTTSFLYEGYCYGKYFKKECVQNGRVILRISSEMDPNDGIMDIYIAERVIDEEYKVYIFVDEDWKAKMPATNIISGNDKSYTKSKRFIFRKVGEGIYMDEINDDPSRFMYSHRLSLTGIIVGDITLQQVQNGITEGVIAVIFQ